MAVELPVIHSTPAPKRGPDSDPERERLFARARLLARGGLAWHGVEAAVAIAAGAVAGSIALIAFGADSLIEALAGIIVLWRFAASRVDSEHAERRAQQLIAITFWLLAAYVTVDATITLATGDHPASSPVGIGLSIVTLIAMPLLANAKANVAKQLGSSAGHSESRQKPALRLPVRRTPRRTHPQRSPRLVVGRPDRRAHHRRGRRPRGTRELARGELLHLTHPRRRHARANARRSSPPARRFARWRGPQDPGPSKPPR